MILLSRKETELIKGDFRYFIIMIGSVDGLSAAIYLLNNLFYFGTTFGPFYYLLLFFYESCPIPISSLPFSYSRYLSIVHPTSQKYRQYFGTKKRILTFCLATYSLLYIFLPYALNLVNVVLFKIAFFIRFKQKFVVHEVLIGSLNRRDLSTIFILLISFLSTAFWLLKSQKALKHHTAKKNRLISEEKLRKSRDAVKIMKITLVIETVMTLPQILTLPATLVRLIVQIVVIFIGEDNAILKILS